MKKKTSGVFQFKITLQDVKPAVWRRIQTPADYSFWDLHVAIQDAMGWHDRHLHEFRILDPESSDVHSIGIPGDAALGEDPSMVHCRESSTSNYFSAQNSSGRYVYDFGDDWNHEIVLEESLPAAKSVQCPVCLDGRGACPPEDCGGPYGYSEFLRAIKKPGSPRGGELLDWVGGSFDPRAFELENVAFDDPEARWSWAFRECAMLENEIRIMQTSPPRPDRHGRVAYRIPAAQHRLLMQHSGRFSADLLDQFDSAVLKNGVAAVKLDTGELKALGSCLASAEKSLLKLDRRIMGALREHFTTMESLARGN